MAKQGELSNTVFNDQKVQEAEGRHDAKYDNDVPADSWLRSDGTKKPDFDKGNAWRKGKGL